MVKLVLPLVLLGACAPEPIREYIQLDVGCDEFREVRPSLTDELIDGASDAMIDYLARLDAGMQEACK